MGVKEIRDLALGLRKKYAATAQRLSTKFIDAGDASPIAAFNMIHNDLIIAAELLNHYDAVWSKTYRGTPEKLDQTRNENGARVLATTKYTFMSSMSSIEFAAKQALRAHPGLLPIDFTNRVYLGRIIEESERAGWINAGTRSNLDDLIYVRNCLVHNNGIADRDRDLFHPGGQTVHATDGMMLQGNLRFFLEYVGFACEAFEEWSEGFLNAK